jgi:pyruvate formate lyase activating enzyme
MKVYQVVKFKDGSAYATFWGCDWECTYCIWKKEKWNICLSQHLRDELDKRWSSKDISFLEIDDFINLLKANNVDLVFLGGGEPTQDPQLKDFLITARENRIESWIITNSENMDEFFDLAKGFTMSLKALDENLHLKITGHSNEKVIKNFEKFGKSEKVVAESVYSKGLVECDEMMKIAKFLSKINKDIKFRIDPEVNEGLNEELDECIEHVRKIIPNTYRIKVTGKVEPPQLLYPKI